MSDWLPAPATWACPNGHEQPWACVLSVEGDRPVCARCFNEWAARKFPTAKRREPKK